MRTPTLPADEVARIRDGRARAIVRHAAADVPYYHGIDPAHIGSAAELSRLPILERSDVRAHLDELRSPGVGADLHVVHTSGVVAERLPISHDRQSLLRNVVWSRRENRPVATFGVPSFGGAVVAILEPSATARQVDRANTRLAWRPGRPTKVVVSTDDPLDAAIEAIESTRPDMVVGFGSYLELLFRTIALGGGLRHRPKVIRYGADGMTEFGRAEIEGALGIPVLSGYGAAESLRIGFTCELRTGFHLHDDLVHAVAVDASGAPVPDGSPGELVLSNLVNRGTVLLNYRLGDVGAIEREPCSCGRSSPRLRLIGRTVETLRLPDGRVVLPDAVRACFDGLRRIVRFQLVELERARFELRLRTGDGGESEDVREAEDAIRSLLEGCDVATVVDPGLGPVGGEKWVAVVPRPPV